MNRDDVVEALEFIRRHLPKHGALEQHFPTTVMAMRDKVDATLASLSEAQPEEGQVDGPQCREWRPDAEDWYCLNCGMPETGHFTALSRNHDEARTLWLWRNGEGEYVAYDNPFPTRDGGDPLTLGGPCGRAILRASINGRPEYPEDQVVADIARALKGDSK